VPFWSADRFGEEDRLEVSRLRWYFPELPVASSQTGCGLMDALPPLELTGDEAEALRAAGVLTFPSAAVSQDQDGTILLIERWAGLPPDEPETAG
jgi:hypothetical protein